MTELIVKKEESGQRLDKFLKKYLREAPDSFLYKMLRKKNITLNGKKSQGREALAEGDVIRLFLSDETVEKFRGTGSVQPAAGTGKVPEPQVVFENAAVLFYNKPAGLLVQPDASGAPSIAQQLQGWLLARKGIDRELLRAQRPAPVNRLDRNTTGLVLCGKTLQGLQLLSQAVRERSVQKKYLVLAGKLPVGEKMLQDGIYKAFAVKDEKHNRMQLFGSEQEGSVMMLTEIRTLAEGDSLNLLEIGLITGRTHQIRAHLRYLGMPVAGDPKYGDPEVNEKLKKTCGVRRQLLHAAAILFPEDEALGELSGMVQKAPLPDDFLKVLQKEHIDTAGID
ncbi:MAG: RluA family pseudouridine synthase [Lachnospiraceae bacterium]|nr:RluA family pseudouridine synthase [Lachnospiraceae bacterium]